ncbi:MAG: HAMP domain-containing protein [Proteobacteria bacterium]|nr:HAMP domain-containing protein [Pseudomonadota bacterium]
MFRVKIALLSVLLSGSVLVGLGLYSLSVMTNVGMARIDREILTLGEGHFATRPPRGYWENFETSLRFIYGEERMGDLIVQIKAAQNEILFKSSRWPAEIAEDSFPDFDRAMDIIRPPAPDDRAGEEHHPSPPPEAYKACEGKGAGSPGHFANPRGETVRGICEDDEGKLVLRPTLPSGNVRGPANDGPGERPVPPPPESNRPDTPMPRIKKPYFATIQTPSGTWRTGIMGSDRITMMVGVNMAPFYEDATRYRRAFLSIVPIALLLLAGGGWVIAQRALKPVVLITRTAEGMTARGLDQRVPLIDADSEFSRLVEVINGMLDRLEKSFGQAVRFSADAAHELQTPLAILQGELDDAVQHAPGGSEEQRRYSGLLEEVQRLKVIVQKLLILARADAGRLDLHIEATDLSAMIESAAEDAGAIAPHLQVEKQIVPGVTVKADPDLMGQAIRNLTSNAVKYNQENGFIRFQLSVREDKAYFIISNTGDPIPTKDREKIFDRFYRVDQSRSGVVPGSGLGLSLAWEIVHAHGGNLRLEVCSSNIVSFTLSLPYISC